MHERLTIMNHALPGVDGPAVGRRGAWARRLGPAMRPMRVPGSLPPSLCWCALKRQPRASVWPTESMQEVHVQRGLLVSTHALTA
jgi:hypothetical protein